ncbi:hypothetical protein [Acetobacter musti]|nr:hypothetical protein [Acetobacter musti]
MREPTPEMIEAGLRAYSRTSLEDLADVAITNTLKAALAAAPSPWRPVCEAPDDMHNALLVEDDGEPFVGTRVSGGWWNYSGCSADPTHFMEIPAAPEPDRPS